METQQITRFILRSRDAIEQGDAATAKQYVLQAIAGADNEMEKLLTGLEVDESEQRLSEWFGACSFILSQIGDYDMTQKYFYTAIVFDQQWKVENHATVSQVVWHELVYTKSPQELQLDLEKLLRRLAELDTLAKLAETRKKWNVCIAIDEDINKVYQFLKVNGVIRNDIISIHGRKAAMWRTARCFLKVGLYKDAGRMCRTILHHACEYDDSEAFDIWAQSLFETKTYELALEKCRLALHYCQDGDDKQRIECFYSKIEKQLTLSRNCELAADGAAADRHNPNRHNPNPETKKNHSSSNRNYSQQKSSIQRSFSETDRNLRSQTLTPETEQCVIAPKPILDSLANNKSACKQHMADPVGCLTHFATSPTCDKYNSVKQYLERWLPLMSMEAAIGVLRNEESCCINSVQVNFSSERIGEFSLSLSECEMRNIEFSGTTSDDKDEDDSEFSSSYDWLCLKTTTSNDVKTLNVKKPLNSTWVGHARVIRVERKKDVRPSGKITVSFELHENASVPVPQSPDQTFSIEILRKSEVDRRAESYIKTLPSMTDSLACKIALNLPIPDLDEMYKHTASLLERDLIYEASKGKKDQRPLPPNNEKQQKAIDKALKSRFSLIQGPPGTGKTYTGIKLLYLFDQINRIRQKEGSPSKQVLFCGQSNKSVDLVAEWMYYRMGKFRPKFVRVYGRSIEAQDFPIPGHTFDSNNGTTNLKTNPEMYPVALHYLIRQKEKKYAEEINTYDKLFKANNYEPMPDLVKHYLHLVKEASIDEIRNYDIILCSTTVGSDPTILKATCLQQVIVDEAGMCPEPLCLVSIIATKPEQVVLIGDHKQLRPIILSKEAALLGYETSLFERYALSESAKNVQFTMLQEQYCMNPEICRFPSWQFYDNNLKTRKGPWFGSSLNIWPRKSSKQSPNIYITYPHVLVHVEGKETMFTVSTGDGNEQSISNLAEIDHVVKVYKYLTIEATGSIQILSQYNGQCSEIKRKLAEEGFPGVNVNSIVSSQGGEWDYVIFSTVRSLPVYKIERNPTRGWCKHNLGLISDQNQVNVALTRARKGLIIIGNKNVLTCDLVWRQLISHYENNGCVKSAEEFPPPITSTRRDRMKRNVCENHLRYGESKHGKVKSLGRKAMKARSPQTPSTRT